MHAVVMDSLEEYLSGTLEPAGKRTIEAHLNACKTCSEALREMQDISLLFGALRRPEEAVEASQGFFAGVMQLAGAQRRPAPSFAGLFALDFAFGRRLVFASLVMLAILGSYLVSREAEYTGPGPEAVMAQQESPAFDSAPAPDNMLVTLTAYEQH
jgi:anti-sigma factor RsiW